MIINTTPALRRNFVAGTENAHLAEGKLAIITANNEIQLIDSPTGESHGVISEPDSQVAAAASGRPSATLILHTFGGIAQFQVGASPGSITPGILLKQNADASVSAATGGTGERIVGRATGIITSETAGQLVPGVMLVPYTTA